MKSRENVDAYLEEHAPAKGIAAAREAEPADDFGGEHTSICGSADFLNCCPSKHQMNDSTLCNRLVMASFAVVLLWMSSLGVALSIVQWAIPTPTTEAVYSSCSYAYDVAANERTGYIECAQRQLDSCDDRFAEAIDGTLSTVLANFAYNTDLLNTAKQQQAMCADASTSAQAALGEWQKGGTAQGIDYDQQTCQDTSQLSTCFVDCSLDAAVSANSSCTCAKVASMVKDVSSVRSEAFGQATGYAAYTAAVVDALTRYANDRAAYDAEYINNHTAGVREKLFKALSAASLPHIKGINASFGPLVPQVDALISCVSLRDGENFTSCAPVSLDSVRERFEEVMGQLGAQLDVAREGFEDFAGDAADYAADVFTAVGNMADFYEGFKTWIEVVAVDTSDMGDWFGLSLDDFLVADPTWPSGVGITSSLQSIPGAGAIWKQVAPLYEEFVGNISLASLGTHKLAVGWAADIGDLTNSYPGFFPDDYKPPQFSEYYDARNVSEAKKRSDADADTFVAKEAVALNAFSEVESYDDDNDGSLFGGYNFSISDDVFNFVGGLYFPFEPLTASNLKFNVWVSSVGDLAALLVYFDYAYRAYQSLVIFARFWSRSGIRIPDVDMRVDRDQVKFAFMSPVHLFWHLLTQPAILGVIFFLAVVLFVVYFCAVYVPVLAAYKAGCVTGTANGTFFTNNLFSVSYNYAATDGNEDLFNGLSDYNVAKADYCSTYATSTQQQQNEDALFMASLKQSHRAARDDVNLLRQCLDEQAMDDAFAMACCGAHPSYDACSAYGTDDLWLNSSLACPINAATGQPFAPVGSYLGEPACLEPAAWADWALKDAVFYCGDVPDCAATCSGPSAPLLRTVSEQCGCSSEWLMHAAFLRSSIGLVVYLLLNASRVLFLGAVCKLLWRYLSPGIFTYKATCDHHGNVLAPRDTEKYESFTGPTGSLKKELNRTLLRFVRTAWLQVAAAALLNAVWMYFLVAARQNIAYEPSV